MILESIHLRGAAGAVRIESHDGLEHFVLPCIALIGEQVIHAVNSPQAERITTAMLVKAAASFERKPVVFGHPVRNGKQISANSPEVLASHGIGIIKNSRVEGKRLLCEAWIDPLRAAKLGGAKFVEDLRANVPCDVSVGAFVSVDDIPGELNGKRFAASWRETNGDHLAVLYPNGRGACSWDAGCGLRAAMHLVTAEGFEIQEEKPMPSTVKNLKARILALFDTSEPAPEVIEAIDALRTAAGARNSAADLAMIQTVHDHSTSLGATCEYANARFMEGASGWRPRYDEWRRIGLATLAKMKDCTSCEGTGQMKDGDKQADCEACGGSGELKALLIQAEPELKAAEATCGCGGRSAEETKMTEQEVKALEAENVALKAAAEKHAAELKAAQDKADVQLKAAEAKQADVDAQLAAVKPIVEAHQAAELKQKTDLVTSLKTAQKAYTEAELSEKPIAELLKLAQITKVEAPADYSGRGVAVQRSASAEDFTPPDPYAADLKALQESKAVN